MADIRQYFSVMNPDGNNNNSIDVVLSNTTYAPEPLNQYYYNINAIHSHILIPSRPIFALAKTSITDPKDEDAEAAADTHTNEAVSDGATAFNGDTPIDQSRHLVADKFHHDTVSPVTKNAVAKNELTMTTASSDNNPLESAAQPASASKAATDMPAQISVAHIQSGVPDNICHDLASSVTKNTLTDNPLASVAQPASKAATDMAAQISVAQMATSSKDTQIFSPIRPALPCDDADIWKHLNVIMAQPITDVESFRLAISRWTGLDVYLDGVRAMLYYYPETVETFFVSTLPFIIECVLQLKALVAAAEVHAFIIA